jgi:hypothetical protein
MIHLSVRELGIAAAAICAAWLVARVVRNARRLNAGVRAFKVEQEKQQGVVIDPYAALSSLYTPVKPVKPGKKAPDSEERWD